MVPHYTGIVQPSDIEHGPCLPRAAAYGWNVGRVFLAGVRLDSPLRSDSFLLLAMVTAVVV